MRVGILGSGLMGGKLGTIFARAGHEVTFSYSHSRRKLERLARRAGRTARAGTPAEAVRDADTLLLAVHWSRVDDVLKQAGDLSGRIVISCSLPMNKADTDLVVGRTSSGAERLAGKVRNAHVVSAFNTVPSEVLFGVFRSRKRLRPSLVYCGDNAGAKHVAAELIRDARFDPVDAGPLETARYTEPFALLAAHLAYEGEGGPALAYRFANGSPIRVDEVLRSGSVVLRRANRRRLPDEQTAGVVVRRRRASVDAPGANGLPKARRRLRSQATIAR